MNGDPYSKRDDASVGPAFWIEVMEAVFRQNVDQWGAVIRLALLLISTGIPIFVALFFANR